MQKAIYFIPKRYKIVQFYKLIEENTLNVYILLQKYRILLKLLNFVKKMQKCISFITKDASNMFYKNMQNYLIW